MPCSRPVTDTLSCVIDERYPWLPMMTKIGYTGLGRVLAEGHTARTGNILASQRDEGLTLNSLPEKLRVQMAEFASAFLAESLVAPIGFGFRELKLPEPSRPLPVGPVSTLYQGQLLAALNAVATMPDPPFRQQTVRQAAALVMPPRTPSAKKVTVRQVAGTISPATAQLIAMTCIYVALLLLFLERVQERSVALAFTLVAGGLLATC
jgi:hypothetical protein